MSRGVLDYHLAPDGVAVATLNRPARRNALDSALVDALVEMLERYGASPEAKVLVLTGAGDAFCAGGDLADLDAMCAADNATRRDYLWSHYQRIPRSFAALDKPVIAAVNGAARGAGMDIALMCDLRFAGRSATFAETYIHLGLVAGDGGAWFLTRLVGATRALDLLWTGRTVDAAEAAAAGLVTAVVADEALLEHAISTARQIAAQPSTAVRMIKRAVHGATAAALDAHLDMVASHMAVLYDSETFRSRLAAMRGPKGKR